MDENPAGCQRWIVRRKQQQQQQQIKLNNNNNKNEKFKDYCEADNNVHCIYFSEQFFGWPYQPPQITDVTVADYILHSTPFSTFLTSLPPFIMLGYPA